MDNAQSPAPDTAVEVDVSASNAVIRARAARLISQAKAARKNMRKGYGTDVTAMSAAEFETHIRRLMPGG